MKASGPSGPSKTVTLKCRASWVLYGSITTAGPSELCPSKPASSCSSPCAACAASAVPIAAVMRRPLQPLAGLMTYTCCSWCQPCLSTKASNLDDQLSRDARSETSICHAGITGYPSSFNLLRSLSLSPARSVACAGECGPPKTGSTTLLKACCNRARCGAVMPDVDTAGNRASCPLPPLAVRPTARSSSEAKLAPPSRAATAPAASSGAPTPCREAGEISVTDRSSLRWSKRTRTPAWSSAAPPLASPPAVLLNAGAGHPVYMQSTVHLAALREASRSSSDPPGAPSNTVSVIGGSSCISRASGLNGCSWYTAGICSASCASSARAPSGASWSAKRSMRAAREPVTSSPRCWSSARNCRTSMASNCCIWGTLLCLAFAATSTLWEVSRSTMSYLLPSMDNPSTPSAVRSSDTLSLRTIKVGMELITSGSAFSSVSKIPELLMPVAACDFWSSSR
mmetsp:Transcript_7671/g.20427  ORF Transcript_7671/g.20427 Transcript_7671/m.20427 type:complete len:455 (-) Transcript_7671:367-1731(-)